MSDQKFIVRTHTDGESDYQEDEFDTVALADAFAKASRANGYVAEVSEKQPDLFA